MRLADAADTVRELQMFDRRVGRNASTWYRCWYVPHLT
jgi:hypothetical protein